MPIHPLINTVPKASINRNFCSVFHLRWQSTTNVISPPHPPTHHPCNIIHKTTSSFVSNQQRTWLAPPNPLPTHHPCNIIHKTTSSFVCNHHCLCWKMQYLHVPEGTCHQKQNDTPLWLLRNYLHNQFDICQNVQSNFVLLALVKRPPINKRCLAGRRRCLADFVSLVLFGKLRFAPFSFSQAMLAFPFSRFPMDLRRHPASCSAWHLQFVLKKNQTKRKSNGFKWKSKFKKLFKMRKRKLSFKICFPMNPSLADCTASTEHLCLFWHGVLLSQNKTPPEFEIFRKSNENDHWICQMKSSQVNSFSSLFHLSLLLTLFHGLACAYVIVVSLPDYVNILKRIAGHLFLLAMCCEALAKLARPSPMQKCRLKHESSTWKLQPKLLKRQEFSDMSLHLKFASSWNGVSCSRLAKIIQKGWNRAHQKINNKELPTFHQRRPQTIWGVKFPKP